MTYTNYDKNPVIDLNKTDFRDPNVFWYEPGKFWLMTVVLPAEHKARFYSSPNLKNWTLLSEFGPQGYTGAHWECPFLIQLPVEGTNKKKWVLVTSAAGGERGVFEQYFVGDFDGKEFKNDNAADIILRLIMEILIMQLFPGIIYLKSKNIYRLDDSKSSSQLIPGEDKCLLQEI